MDNFIRKSTEEKPQSQFTVSQSRIKITRITANWVKLHFRRKQVGQIKIIPMHGLLTSKHQETE